MKIFIIGTDIDNKKQLNCYTSLYLMNEILIIWTDTLIRLNLKSVCRVLYIIMQGRNTTPKYNIKLFSGSIKDITINKSKRKIDIATYYL